MKETMIPKLLPPGPPRLALPALRSARLDTVHCIDALRFLEALPSNYVNCIVSSPPYWSLRDYNIDGQIGLEDSPQAYIERIVRIYREVRRVLRDDGVCWINLGDSYAGSRAGGGGNRKGNEHGQHDAFIEIGRPSIPNDLKPKDLCGIPWRVALALQADGWYLRSAAPWVKGSAMPESVTDRATTAHEYVFQFSKSAQYWFDSDAVRMPSAGDWTIKGGSILNKTGWTDGAGRNDINRRSGTDQNGSNRNRRTSDTFYEHLDAQIAHWQYVRANGGVLVGEDTLDAFLVNPKGLNLAHFATYPLNLIDPCVKAGCPPQVCAECGAPWERVTEKERVITRPGHYSRTDSTKDFFNAKGSGGNIELRYRKITTTTTLGWQPTCTCNASTRPGIVLDPFMGAGTTALVAIQNNRHYIGSELNPAYVEMARKRIAEFDPYQPVEREDGVTQLSLFGT